MKKYLPFFLAFFFLTSCSNPLREKSVRPAFYHWKGHLSLSDQEKNYLDNINTDKLYVRYFDVKWDAVEQSAFPVSVITTDSIDLDSFQIIPVVFITNETIKSIPANQISELAEKILLKVQSLHTKITPSGFNEIQIDCDWSESSQHSYFRLLEIIREKLNPSSTLSVTLRLHQFKNPEQTGIPPVDKAMLMFYNMGEVNDYSEKNSILNLEIAKKYLQTAEDYSIPLDFALPLFRWGCIFRDQQIIHLSNNLAEKDLLDPDRFIKTESNYFKVVKSTYLNGYFLYEGDEIRLESVTFDQLRQSVKMLEQIANSSTTTVTFYHLDTFNLNRFPSEQLNELLIQFK